MSLILQQQVGAPGYGSEWEDLLQGRTEPVLQKLDVPLCVKRGWVAGHLKSTVVGLGYIATTAVVWLQENTFLCNSQATYKKQLSSSPLVKGLKAFSFLSSSSHLATAAQRCPRTKAAVSNMLRWTVSVLLVGNRTQDSYLGTRLPWTKTTLVEGGWNVGLEKFPWSMQH